MTQADGPFEMYLEAETPGGRQRFKVSESIPLPWDNTPPPQQQPQRIPAAQPPNFGQPPGCRTTRATGDRACRESRDSGRGGRGPAKG